MNEEGKYKQDPKDELKPKYMSSITAQNAYPNQDNVQDSSLTSKQIQLLNSSRNV